ncbi:GNAT family N-acetyltransferase [Streptomyces sp. FH025]|uniref:GNAT family N-acetyltransferase n=1 Tax=Streptomyces sp. FH025 TaxID=2815937 RepID=UPI001A9FFD7E|nr:GNAT family N-acetyltransferase [Streptomyces sp. FH025]MBO1413988.1 GNAT family N-acetyltransferase [Streptomyces sp. FH025]
MSSSESTPELPWHVTAFHIPNGSGGAVELVRRVRELRARILFDGGRRPAFRDTTGSHPDDQELDYGAWHFIGRRQADGRVLGYVRLCSPAPGRVLQTEAFLGSGPFQELLEAEGLPLEATFEHSRLVVEHDARKLGLGVYLNAMVIAAARSLGAKAMIGTSGTADGQDGFHRRFGFRPVEDTRRYVDRYTEEVLIMFQRTADGAGEHSSLVSRLEGVFPGIVAEPETVRLEQPAPDRRPAPEALGRLRSIGSPSTDSWRPVLYRPQNGTDRDGLAALLESGQVREVCDTLDTQLEELIRSREPSQRFDPEALRAAKDRQLAGADLWEYGTWAWYPWSGRLVHLLPRKEFRLVRTDRNRGKIERPEQRRLLERRVGIIGLSVGSSAALTFVMEGIGGAFKLADFDSLGLSNLNRLRAGVHDLGANKAVIAARQMFEIDPYLDIEIHPGGLTGETMDDFFTGGGGPIDLLVEECDTPWVKLAAREKARALGVPVVMDANDRGLLDIERFDLEPDRPLLRGRLGGTTSEDLTDLSFEETVALILAMVDVQRVSPEIAAAIPQIGKTLSSWPQLASGVALGGALTAEAARRILLGKPCASGRFYTDLEVMLAPDRSTVA